MATTLMNFFLEVNSISNSVLNSMATISLSKKWLNLPRNATKATVIHPSVIDCPSLKSSYAKASIDYLIAIKGSNDHSVSDSNSFYC